MLTIEEVGHWLLVAEIVLLAFAIYITVVFFISARAGVFDLHHRLPPSVRFPPPPNEVMVDKKCQHMNQITDGETSFCTDCGSYKEESKNGQKWI